MCVMCEICGCVRDVMFARGCGRTRDNRQTQRRTGRETKDMHAPIEGTDGFLLFFLLVHIAQTS